MLKKKLQLKILVSKITTVNGTHSISKSGYPPAGSSIPGPKKILGPYSIVCPRVNFLLNSFAHGIDL